MTLWKTKPLKFLVNLKILLFIKLEIVKQKGNM